jgi:hypothetical protein
MREVLKHGYFLPRVYEILICIMMDFMHYEHIDCNTYYALKEINLL